MFAKIGHHFYSITTGEKTSAKLENKNEGMNYQARANIFAGLYYLFTQYDDYLFPLQNFNI